MSSKIQTNVVDYWRRSRGWTNSEPVPPWNLGSSLHIVGSSTVETVGGSADWADRIRRGISATTFLSGTRHSFNRGNDGYVYFHRYYEPTNTHRYLELLGSIPDLGHFDNIDDPTNFIIASVQNQSKQRINQEIRKAQKSLQGLVALGELGDTTRMVNRLGRSFFGRTEDYLRDLSKVARHLTPQNVMRTVSEKWLEYKFGIQPLVSDIGGFVDACYQNRYGRPPRVLIRAQSQATEKNQPLVAEQAYSACLVMSHVSQEKTYGYRIYGAVGLTDNHVPPFRQEFGLTLDEFVPTLWELIPYSFLVDYVSNVGAIIDAYSLNKSNVLWLAQGELRQTKKTMSATVIPVAGPGYVFLESIIRPGTPLVRSIRKVDRSPATLNTTIPDLEFRIPGSSTQWLNIGALGYLHATASRALRARR